MSRVVLGIFNVDFGLLGMKRCVNHLRLVFSLSENFAELSEWRKIQDLKYLLGEPASTASDFLFLEPSFSASYHPELLSQSQSDFLAHNYVLYVDPFIRLSHKPRLLLELNHFRRGILPDGQDFECELFVIYALGLIPVTADECMLQMGGEKSTLMRTFKDAAGRGLVRLNVASSHKIRNLRSFLLYIVNMISDTLSCD
jgi:hypothetical protein